MLKKFFLKSRFSLFFSFILFFLAASLLMRMLLLIISWNKAGLLLANIPAIFLKGFIYDVGVAIFFSLVYLFYLLIFPRRWMNSLFDRIANYSIIFLMVLITIFSFFAEFTFWQEFENRFNFIAVDYLIYTYEVINNINESYPLPILISSVVLGSLIITYSFNKLRLFAYTFTSPIALKNRSKVALVMIGVAYIYIAFLKNSWAESSENHYLNELSKAGVYSFFSAFKNNELNYQDFYPKLNNNEAFGVIREELKETNAVFVKKPFSIERVVSTHTPEQKPNVIMITIESFSADFMEHFGNHQHITPFLDSLADKSILFTNMYATGTRTVRGMEALSLAVPPTPGSSIVRRPENDSLTTVGYIFKNKGYQTSFFYGGDGYFDNMNQYFGGNGYDIIDRGRKITVGDEYKAKRTIIADRDVHFENAWGISDEDLYDAVIKNADEQYKNKQLFYDFVMTTSNHRPFTYPNGVIDIPSGSGREGSVKYTDYAIKSFFDKIKNKPWFKNTVVILVADHCASSAGKNEIDISHYHIPCIIANLPKPTKTIDQLSSQIDLYPTLFNMLGWSYQSNLYGKNVLDKNYQPRIVLGTYQKLAYMQQDSLVVLGPQQKIETYIYHKDSNEQVPNRLSKSLIHKAIAQYQTAYYLFKNGGLREINQ